MAASDHLNNDQLRMFMRPDEITGLVEDSVDRRQAEVEEHRFRPAQTMENLWKNKMSEVEKITQHQELAASVEKSGVMRPVTIMPPTEKEGWTMGEGHHRVMAAKRAEEKTGKQQYVPVVYSSDWAETNYPEYGMRG